MATTMNVLTVEELDRRIADLEKMLQVAASNLLALTGLRSFKLLSDKSPDRVVLKGKTALEVNPVLSSFEELFLHRSLVQAVLDQVKDKRNNLPFIGRDKALEEVSALLTGDSVHLPPISVPLAERGLLSEDELKRAVSVDRLMQAMEASYVLANKVLHRVNDAWTKLTISLAAIESEISGLQREANGLAEPADGDLNEAVAKLKALKELILVDPFSVQDGYENDLRPGFDALAAKLKKLKSERESLNADLLSADSWLTDLETAHLAALNAIADRKEKICFSKPMTFKAAPAAESVAELRSWLGRLKTSNDQGNWRAVKVGFSNWKAQLKDRISQCNSAQAENLAPLNRRRELRGLLDALKAKAVNTGVAEDEKLNALYKKAYGLLYTRPTLMEDAEALVEEYRLKVN